MPHTAIILIALGGPRSLDEVGPFMTAFMGRPAPPPVVSAIVDRYKLIGGKSPLPEMVKLQASALEKELGNNYRVYEGFRYSKPTVSESFDRAIADGARRVIALSMSPFATEVTTGAYKSACEGLGSGETCPLFIASWHNNPLFIQAWQEQVFRGLTAILGQNSRSRSSSSLPVTASRCGTSLRVIPTSIRSKKQCDLSWTSSASGTGVLPGRARVRGQPNRGSNPRWSPHWTLIARDGFKAVLEVPIGFTCDHMETLYDIDIVHRAHAEKLGLNFERADIVEYLPAFHQSPGGYCKSGSIMTLLPRSHGESNA